MLIRLGLRNLTRQYRRTVALLITVACGSLGLMCFDGFNHGIMHQYQENTIHARYGYGQINEKGYLEQAFENPWEHWIEKPEEVMTFLQTLTQVTHIFPRVSFGALVTNGSATLAGSGQGIVGEKEALFFHALNFEIGGPLSDKPDEIILGKGLAQGLNLHLGDRVTLMCQTTHGSINALDFNVVGIFHTGSKAFDDVAFQIPLVRAQELLDTQRIESITLGLHNTEQWPEVKRKVDERFSFLESTSFAVLDKVYYQHSVDWLKAQFGFIECILLAIVILGLLNTTSCAIFERMGEIGNLRANGESVFDVVRLLSYESFFIGLLGATLGIIGAWVLVHTVASSGLEMPPAPGLTRSFHIMIELRPEMALRALILSIACSLFANIVGGLHVARMPINQALRAP